MIEISIVIPCFNEEKYISECIYSFITNGYQVDAIEILVIDGGSTDSTLTKVHEINKAYPFVKIIPNPKQKTPFALNIGVLAAQYEYVLIAGAHAKYPVGYLDNLAELIQKPEIDIVGGSIKTCIKNKTSISAAIQFVLTNKWGVGDSQFRIGTNGLTETDTVPFGLYPKQLLVDAGLYNEKLIRNHDIELSKRLKQKGYRIWLTSELPVDYYARETYRALAKNNYGNGFWNAKTLLITRNFNALSLRHYIPLIFVSTVLFPLLLSLLWLPFLWVTIVTLISYLVFLFYVWIKSDKQSQWVPSIIAFMVLHFSYGLGTGTGLIKGLFGKM